MAEQKVSIVIPAKNEAASLGTIVHALRASLPDAEILVVDDGSTDSTEAVARAAGARSLRHPTSRGNGAAVKSGARAASGDVLVFMDADGQHRPDSVRPLLERLTEGYDMVVGARSAEAHASPFRRFANLLYNGLASAITGHRIADLTSGLRAVDARKFRQFLPLLPNGFSYPTTITMAFLRAGYGVTFEPVSVEARAANTQSHIRPLRDGGRFFLIIFRVGTLYSPLKIFVPLSILFFVAGALYYAYTFITAGRFTNLGALLFSTSVVIFLIGLLSEQITALLYLGADRRTPGPDRASAP
jgi:glycosyltransferase involved in cell wall biosynthesis